MQLQLLLLLKAVRHVRRRRRGVRPHRAIRVESVAIPHHFVLTARRRLPYSLWRNLKRPFPHGTSRERHWLFRIDPVSKVTSSPSIGELLRVHACCRLLGVAALRVGVFPAVITRLRLALVQLWWLLVFLLALLYVARLSQSLARIVRTTAAFLLSASNEVR
jgi:hypothetical protein